MASPFALGLAAAVLSLSAGSALACPDVAACGGMSASYGVYTEQASFGPLADQAYGGGYGPDAYADQGPGYGPADGYGDEQGYGPGGQPAPQYEPDAQDGPPPYDPRYDQGAAVYGGASNSYERSSYGYETSSRSSSISSSEAAYDSGWRPVPATAAAHRGAYGAMSVEEHDYDSGWRVHQGPTEVIGVRGQVRERGDWCPPGSAYQHPHPRYGCPLAAGNPVPVPSSFFYDTGGVGPIYGGGGGGGGGGMVVVGGGTRAGAFAFASARASASVHVGGHFGGHGRGHGCGCGGHGGHH